jgi:hypothetical protein
MIHFELLRDRGILVITPNGPLDKVDFDRVDPVIASDGKLAGLVVGTKSFPGWRTFDARSPSISNSLPITTDRSSGLPW